MLNWGCITWPVGFKRLNNQWLHYWCDVTHSSREFLCDTMQEMRHVSWGTVRQCVCPCFAFHPGYCWHFSTGVMQRCAGSSLGTRRNVTCLPCGSVALQWRQSELCVRFGWKQIQYRWIPSFRDRPNVGGSCIFYRLAFEIQVLILIVHKGCLFPHRFDVANAFFHFLTHQ